MGEFQLLEDTGWPVKQPSPQAEGCSLPGLAAAVGAQLDPVAPRPWWQPGQGATEDSWLFKTMQITLSNAQNVASKNLQMNQLHTMLINTVKWQSK